MLFDQTSQYQRVQIVKTVDHGNMLILDGAVNLAENDTVPYTHALMNIPQDEHLYDNANVLILGGGDGGLLKSILELSNVKPKQVTMVDLDEMVIKACSQFMNKTCGHYMDEREGLIYKVIIGDALSFMKDEHDRVIEYDIIFGDLTDVPVDSNDLEATKTHSISSPTQEAWNFIAKVLKLAFSVLKPTTGKYFTHCNGKSVPIVLKQYEQLLEAIRIERGEKCYKPKWTQTESFVPSFMETWVFYQVSLVETETRS